jgi:hypothetical protein
MCWAEGSIHVPAVRTPQPAFGTVATGTAAVASADDPAQPRPQPADGSESWHVRGALNAGHKPPACLARPRRDRPACSRAGAGTFLMTIFLDQAMMINIAAQARIS